MKTIKKITSVICSFTFLLSALPKISADAAAELPKGWLMWHSYSSYEAMDSRLFMKAPDGEITEISGNFKAPMNGAFGKNHDEFVFMAIDEVHDEWDIFLSKSNKITNLTEGSGFRNEDPKFSPDGNSIVFKRGYWDNERNDFSMPFNSADYNCSDACPVGENTMLYSSSQNGSYDLYFYDGNESIPIDGINTENQELGASFLPEDTHVNGDVNEDGFFNIADVVTVQKWLLADPNVKLQNWKAVDFCKDNKIDAFDFCLMKRLFLSQSANPLIGMNYADAVRNKYISKSEYNRQITGELKSAIEEKMGRPIDYSIDRFYQVNGDILGITGDYIFNSATMDIYPVVAETPINRAT